MSVINKKIVIVGGGFAGLGVAIALLEAGERDFVILEKAAQLGGTWRENTYPGCACDVPSQLYSYSFAPNARWSHVFARQPEIQAYLLEVAARFGVLEFVRFNAALERASWDDREQRWAVDAAGERYSARYLIACQGPLHEPRIPALEGLEAFTGQVFHSAQWAHDVPLEGRRVAVIGTGSSAIQFVPQLQPKVASLAVFQRTAPWVLPKPDHAIPAIERAAFAFLPGFQRAYRGALYGLTELLQWAQRRPERMLALERLATWHLTRQIQDPALREVLKPQFSLGCKRLLLSNDWYKALSAPNTTLIPCGVERIGPSGPIGADGVERAADVIIFGTGFHVSDASVPSLIYGRAGESLAQAWDGTPSAYLGTTVHGFPNLFLVIGPNTGNGHGSALTIIEAQAKYIVDALRYAQANMLGSVMPREQAQSAWNVKVQQGLAQTVWNAGGCQSWYLDGNGKNSAIYPWSTLDLRFRLRRFDAAAFELEPLHHHADDAPYDEASAPCPVLAVTGGAQGIGLAIAKRFIAEGYKVAIGDLNLDLAQEAAARLGPSCFAYALDVRQRQSMEAFIDDVERALGPVDVFVNNAGILPSGPYLSEDDDVTAQIFAVNTMGTALGMKVILPRMLARGRGHVVNVASLAGKFAIPYMATYVASKHAVVGLSASVRMELEGTPITLSVILPTAVKTRLAVGVPLEGLWPQNPEDVAQAVWRSAQTHAPELTVPQLAAPLVGLYGASPRRLISWMPKLMGANRLMSAQVRQARQGYEAALGQPQAMHEEQPRA